MIEWLSKSDLSVEKSVYGIRVSAIINGTRESRLYIGYTQGEAVRRFIETFTK